MSDELLTVLGVTLITWLGVFAYLWRLEGRVREIESRTGKK